MKKRKHTEEDIDAIVTKEADDLNRWDAPIHGKPSGVTSIPLSPATISLLHS